MSFIMCFLSLHIHVCTCVYLYIFMLCVYVLKSIGQCFAAFFCLSWFRPGHPPSFGIPAGRAQTYPTLSPNPRGEWPVRTRFTSEFTPGGASSREGILKSPGL